MLLPSKQHAIKLCMENKGLYEVNCSDTASLYMRASIHGIIQDGVKHFCAQNLVEGMLGAAFHGDRQRFRGRCRSDSVHPRKAKCGRNTLFYRRPEDLSGNCTGVVGT